MEQSLEKYTHCNWTLQCTATTHWYTLHRTATNHSAQYRVESRKMHISQSRSEPDSKQKTETELTFWYVFPYFVHSEPFQSKQQQKQVCTSHNWKCDHLWPKCDQTCFAKKTKKRAEKQIRSQIQICDSLWPSQMSQIGHPFGVTGTNLFLFLFGNPARNGSQLNTAAHCNALQRCTATHYNALQQTTKLNIEKSLGKYTHRN